MKRKLIILLSVLWRNVDVVYIIWKEIPPKTRFDRVCSWQMADATSLTPHSHELSKLQFPNKSWPLQSQRNRKYKHKKTLQLYIDVWGDFLGPPHGTATVVAVKIDAFEVWKQQTNTYSSYGNGSFRPLSRSPWVVSPWLVLLPSRFALHYVSRFALLPWVVSPTTWWVVSPTF